eukprot:4647348-Heterocapsa_arctica.AAC.1
MDKADDGDLDDLVEDPDVAEDIDPDDVAEDLLDQLPLEDADALMDDEGPGAGLAPPPAPPPALARDSGGSGAIPHARGQPARGGARARIDFTDDYAIEFEQDNPKRVGTRA